ncbi:MAG TPA: zinc-ribbon domain-containing protein [Anaeromyxobacter sp.]
MIVICTKCQAKFRVADEKIGPRGAKVRCSRCQTIFLVQADPGAVLAVDAAASPAAPAVDLETRTSALRAPRPENPFAAPGPFAAAGHRPAGADPFAEAEGSRATLAVTDLSDLLGAGPPPAAKRSGAVPPPLPPPARAAPADDPFAAPAAPAFEAAPSFDAEPPAFDTAPPSFDTEPSFEAVPALDGSAPALAADPFDSAAAPLEAPDPFAAASGRRADLAPLEPPAPDDAADDGGLALEDRVTPPPAKAMPREPAGAFDGSVSLEMPLPHGPRAPSDDPFALEPAVGEPFDRGVFDFSSEPGGEPLATAAAPRPPPAAAPAPAALRAATPRAAARPRPQTEERIPGQRGSRLRAVAVNAVALAVLLLVALALWVVWRSDGPLEAGSLRPSTVLGALERGGGSGPFTAQEVRSGVYERERGPPLLFVRGTVLSRAPARVASVKVSVEIVRAGEVVARGETIAGAVPTPEELFRAVDDAALQAARASARARAPAHVRPGDAVPFLVAIGDAPPDLDGASLRLAVAPAGAGAQP